MLSLTAALIGKQNQAHIPLLTGVQDNSESLQNETEARQNADAAILGVMSTDTERLQAVQSLVEQFESADSTVVSALESLVAAEENSRQLADTNLQAQINQSNVQLSTNTSQLSSCIVSR